MLGMNIATKAEWEGVSPQVKMIPKSRIINCCKHLCALLNVVEHHL